MYPIDDDPHRPPQAYSQPEPTQQFAPYGPPPQYQPPAPVHRDSNTVVIALLSVLSVAVIAGIGLVIWLLVFHEGGSDASRTVTASPSVAAPGSQGAPPAIPAPAPAPSASLPSSATRCDSVYGNMNGYVGSAVGSAVTSCPFAEEVRFAYIQGGPRGGSRMVSAFSPVTGTSYPMNCVANSSVVTCAGGDDAVVYIY